MANLRVACSALRAVPSTQPAARTMLMHINWKGAQHSRRPFSNVVSRLQMARKPQKLRTPSPPHQDPPPPRQSFGSSSGNLAVWSVIAGCIGLYGYEQVQLMEAQKGSKAGYASLQWINKHFVLSLDAIREGRYYVVLTSSFAHTSGGHLICNMMALAGFGMTFVRWFGVPHFAMLWVGSAVFGSILQLGYWQKIEQPGAKYAAVGASGALFGITSALSFVYPKMPISVLFFINMTLRTSMVITAALSVAAINQGWLPWLGHVDHLGGMAFGFVYWLVALRRGRIVRIS